MYNFKANKALYFCDFRLLKKQHLVLKSPVFTSSSRHRLIRDVGTDIGMDIKTNIETVIKWLLLYYVVPIAAKKELSLGHGRTEVVKDRCGRRD